MWRSSVFVVMLAVVGCADDGFVGELNVATAATSGNASVDAVSLDHAREVLHTRTASHVGPIALNGYNFHREVEIGRGVRVIVISRNLGGGLLVFGSDGKNFASAETKEITWLQLFDLDEDGVAEIATEEVEGRGTGVLAKRFFVYRLDGNVIARVWDGDSYSRRASTPEAVEESLGFIRFDASGAGRNPRLTHLVIDALGQPRQATFEWRNGALEPTR